MFRTKLSVDRHVQELFRKVKDENERTMRCYNIAKLYFQVEDYESARRYVSCYLEAKDDQAGPHKLLGKIYEALGQKESALSQYKQSLELEPRQDDLVLKVCELLADMEIGHDVNRVKYWVDRADERFPHHPTVFQLKEKLLTIDRPNNGNEDLEALIAAELSARPSDVQLRVKLLKYYMDKSRLDDAYKHALDVESTHAHRDSVAWYEALCELLSKCKDGRQSKWSFWIMYVSSLERYAALTLKEQGHVLKKTVSEAAQAVFNFDQALTEAKLQEYSNRATFAEHMFTHMWGQLHFHLASLLLRKTKREQGSWSDTGRLCAPLLLAAMHVQPVDTTSTWALNLKDQAKSQIQLWHREASYRCSQAGHVLRSYARDDVKRIMDKIDKFCVGAWRERIYQRIFVSKAHIATSYFANHTAANPPFRLCSSTEMNIYDKVAETVWPASLHHHVWLGIVNARASNNRNIHEESDPRPHQYCHVFPALQLSVYNLSQAAADSLGQLDIDAFLNATVLCASVVVEEQQRSGFMSPERLPILPADITNTLCTSTQEKWWYSAYKIYRKQEDMSSDLGEIRQELQRGLEVIRCIGNHGLHPAILVHLARIFHHRAKLLKEKDVNQSDLPFLEARCELYWSAVVPLLERLLNNQTIRTTSTKMFDYQGKEMNNVELTNALEEGRLLLAQRYIRDKQHEQAIEALQALKCPEASFMQGEIYKSLADELMSTLPKESLTSAMRSQHISMLSKARGCYYLTLDRLRSPGMNPKHPLNSELGTRIADIENDLKKIDPDVWRANRNECDVMSEESYSSAHSGDQPVVQNNFSSAHGHVMHMLGTPQKSLAHRTPKQASTPCRIQHQDILELTRRSTQQEARPSPERLDAQIRQLIHSKDNMIQTILEQNKTLLESNKSLVESNKTMSEKIEELQRQFANFCKEARQQQSRQNRARSISTGQNNLDEDLYIIGDEDYADLSYAQPSQQQQQQQQQTTAQPAQIPANLFLQQQQQQQQQRNPYSPLAYPQVAAAAAAAAALQTYYPAAMPFGDPHAQHISSLYGGSRVFQMPAYYPRPPLEQSLGGLPKMPENMQGLFTNRPMNHLSDLAPQAQQQLPQQPAMPPLSNPQLSMHLQNFDVTRNELPAKDVNVSQPQQPVKDTIVSRPAPVNVVITTSDTLPTTAPSVQPPLSVTIPPQYRAASTIGHSIATTASIAIGNAAPHSYQISMPSHAMIPTTVNLPPLSTTITNTISATIAEQENNQQKITSVLSTSAHNCSGDGSEIEHDPLPDFVPVIPLPAEIQVTTGEENEDTLFCSRAKLYRWSDREWKERGVGNVKLLRNPEGKVRLVMRREQVLKICANHMLTADMVLTKMSNNDKAWIWVANDFADEEVKLEKLCIKFKHTEEAQAFKDNFDKAKASSTVVPIVKSTETMKIGGTTSSSIVPTTTTEASVDKTEMPKTTIGGFSFSSEPIIQRVTTLEPVKNEETPKPSPFADFSFTKSSSNGTSTGFSFVKSTSTTPNTVKTTTSVDTIEKTTLRRPHAAAPGKLTSAVNQEQKSDDKTPEISGIINSDGEAVLYEKQTNLMRCSGESGPWKNRGLGNVKILLDPITGKLRLLIKREETGKIFCNYAIVDRTKFALLASTDNVVTWNVQEASKGKTESLGCVFETPEQATRFKNLITSVQHKMSNDRVPMDSLRHDGKIVRLIDASNKAEKPSLAEIFKAPAGSWECSSCYTRNDSTARKCLACEAEMPNIPKASQANETAEKSSLWNAFKPQPESWECQSCYIRNSKENSYCVACDTAKDPSMPPKQKTGGFNLKGTSKEDTSANFTFGIPKSSGNTLAEMFKPQAGSWECQGCLLRNSETAIYCVACEAPKDPSMPPKPKSTVANVDAGKTPSFSFGIPQNTAKDATTATGGFTFKLQTRDEKSSTDTKVTPTLPVFGASKISAPSSNFVFGMPPRPTTPQNSETTTAGFTFGSPGKSFDFQFTTKSPSTKSPGGPNAKSDVSEDEVAESEDVYFAPVVPLPDKIDVKTGEEDEEIVYSHRAKLFRFDIADKEWKERGLGDIKILRNPASRKLRMVMRRDQTLKLCLNHAVTKELELKAKDEKTWLWNAADYSEGDIDYLQLACRFKTAEIANDFKKNLINALEDTSKPGNDDTSSAIEAPSPHDIQVVYEVKATDEEKAAALKLQLPENFYAYKLKDDCAGCRGCREPEFPLYQNENTKNVSQSPIVAKLAPPKLGFAVNSEVSTSNVSQLENSGNKEETKKFTGFSFGSSAQSAERPNIFSGGKTMQQTDKSSPFSSGFNAENLSICSPSSVDNRPKTSTDEQSENQQQPFGRIQSVFGGSSFTGQTSIFGGTPNTGISIFGGNAIAKSPLEAPKETDATLGSSVQNIFGGATKSLTVGANPIFGSQSFGNSGNNQISFGNNIFGGKSATHTFGVSNTGGNIFGSGITGNEGKLSFGSLTTMAESPQNENAREPSSTEEKAAGDGATEKTETPSFLSPSSNVTFSTLAAQQPGNTFKKDPNFSFAGAGATVFGGKSTIVASPDTAKSTVTKKITNDADDDEENNEEPNEEHDPHFEPIVPLPDAIEVRTGEEDEEKLFAERAKLFRFEAETKEWKERGIGEMKLLHHSVHGTYRLLLRREQVHKLVCNQLVTVDLELKPLSSSDRAWVWASFNHAEEPYALEELAVRFKTPELALQFKEAVEKAKIDLQQRQASEQERISETITTEGYAEEDHDNEVDEDEEDEEHSMIFASRIDLLALEENTWKSIGSGILKILYDSEIYGAKIIVEADDTGEILSNTVITMETTMELNQNSCTWTAIDEVPNPPMRRSLKAVFAYFELAQEMYMNFQDGREYAKQADISETSYYDPRIE